MALRMSLTPVLLLTDFQPFPVLFTYMAQWTRSLACASEISPAYTFTDDTPASARVRTPDNSLTPLYKRVHS